MLNYALLITTETAKAKVLLTSLEASGWIVFWTCSIEEALSLLNMGCLPDAIVVTKNSFAQVSDDEVSNKIQVVSSAPLFFLSENESPATLLKNLRTGFRNKLFSSYGLE